MTRTGLAARQYKGALAAPIPMDAAFLFLPVVRGARLTFWWAVWDTLTGVPVPLSGPPTYTVCHPYLAVRVAGLFLATKESFMTNRETTGSTSVSSTHSDNNQTSSNQNIALAALRAQDVANDLRHSLGGIDALLDLLDVFNTTSLSNIRASDLAELLRPLVEKMQVCVLNVDEQLELIKQTKRAAIALLDTQDFANDLRGSLCGFDAVLGLLDARGDQTLSGILALNFSSLLRPVAEKSTMKAEGLFNTLSEIKRQINMSDEQAAVQHES